MADSKRSPGRLNSLRDSVKKITERLSDGDSSMMKKNDEYIREMEKLRVHIQSMEVELRQLHHSRHQLEQVARQNEKLAATLQDAKGQIEALRAEVDKLTAPPSSYGIRRRHGPTGSRSAAVRRLWCCGDLRDPLSAVG